MKYVSQARFVAAEARVRELEVSHFIKTTEININDCCTKISREHLEVAMAAKARDMDVKDEQLARLREEVSKLTEQLPRSGELRESPTVRMNVMCATYIRVRDVLVVQKHGETYKLGMLNPN